MKDKKYKELANLITLILLCAFFLCVSYNIGYVLYKSGIYIGYNDSVFNVLIHGIVFWVILSKVFNYVINVISDTIDDIRNDNI